MEIEMESDRELFTETDIEDCRQHKSLHSSISKSEFKYHHTKAEPSRNRFVNKRRHGDFRQEPEDANESCNDNSHSLAFVSGEVGLTKVVKLKLNFGKTVIHEGFYVVEQSLTKKSEDRINKEGWREKKSVGHESSEYRLRGEVGKTKQVKGNKGGRENSKSVKRIKRCGHNFENSRKTRNQIEIEEMWKAVAGDSEDEIADQRTIEDDVFIDDTQVDPHYCILTDDNAFIHNAPQAEEGEKDEEIDNLFKSRKKKKKGLVRSPEETALMIEQFLAKFEVAAEEDAEFNRQSRPAINKLKMLPLLREALSKKHLQQEFLDRGILSVLKNWLEPLPDGCLPNINIRTAILKILTDLPVNVEHSNMKELLKKSGLGKSIMFLSKSKEEIPSNKKLARDLVDEWTRPIFQKSTRYEDMKEFEELRDPYRRLLPSGVPKEKAMALRIKDGGNGLEVLELSRRSNPREKVSRQHVSRPEASRLDYVVRPQSRIDPDEIRARSNQRKQSERWAKLDKKLNNLKAPKKKRLQAAKISVEGRGLVKYL